MGMCNDGTGYRCVAGQRGGWWVDGRERGLGVRVQCRARGTAGGWAGERAGVVSGGRGGTGMGVCGVEGANGIWDGGVCVGVGGEGVGRVGGSGDGGCAGRVGTGVLCVWGWGWRTRVER